MVCLSTARTASFPRLCDLPSDLTVRRALLAKFPLMVGPEGESVLTFFDEQGKTARMIHRLEEPSLPLHEHERIIRMIDGLYAASFGSNLGMAGTGVVIFDGGRLHGGDASYFYKGKFRLDDNRIIATVDVVHYAGQLNSVFGPARQFRLTLNGVINPPGFSLSGQVKGSPNLTINIEVRKISDLVEQD